MTLLPFDRNLEATVVLPPLGELTVGIPVPPPALLLRPKRERIVDRILCKVVHLATASTGSVAWRGQTLKARFFPGTSYFTVGEVCLAKRIGHSTEWAISKRVSLDLLWFTPGSPHPHTHGELWVYDGSACARVWSAPNNYEEISCLFWCRQNSTLYMATYCMDDWYARIYRVDVSTGTPTLVDSWNDSLGDPFNCEPVCDAAEFGNYIYLHCGGFYGDPVAEVRRFDLTTELSTPVYSYSGAGSYAAYVGGIAVDPIANQLVASSGYQVWRSPSGDVGSWVLDQDIALSFGVYDCPGLVTNRGDDDLVYSGADDALPANILLKRNGAGAWAVELTEAARQTQGVVTHTTEWAGSTPVALYAQTWGWNSDQPSIIYRKAAGAGVWTTDYTSENKLAGAYSQGMGQYRDKVYALFFQYYPIGTTNTYLHVRQAAGNWPLVQGFTGYAPLAVHPGGLSMCAAPNTTRYCHEV